MDPPSFGYQHLCSAYSQQCEVDWKSRDCAQHPHSAWWKSEVNIFENSRLKYGRTGLDLGEKKNGINVLPLNIPFSVLKSINQVTSLKVFSGNQSSKYSKTAGHDLFEILPETSLLGPPDTFICFSTRSPGKEFKRSVCKNYTGVCSRRQEGVAIVAYWYRTVSSIVTYWHHTGLLVPPCVVNSDFIGTTLCCQ